MDVSKLRTGTAVMAESARRKGRYTPFIYWTENNESKYLAFLTPIEEVPTIQVHPFIPTPGGKRLFVCRKNAFLLEESGGVCPLCDDHDEKPVTRQVALAVELKPIEKRESGRKQITGFSVLMDEFEKQDGSTATAPHVGMVIQASSNFWMPLSSFTTRKGDITEYVLEVQRVGKDQKTIYQFFEYNGDSRPDLSEFEDDVPDLIEWIAEKGSEEYYASELDGYSGGGDRPASRGGGNRRSSSEGGDEAPEGDAFNSLVDGLRKKEQPKPAAAEAEAEDAGDEPAEAEAAAS